MKYALLLGLAMGVPAEDTTVWVFVSPDSPDAGRILMKDRAGACREVGTPQCRENIGTKDHGMAMAIAVCRPKHGLVGGTEGVQRSSHRLGADQRHINRHHEHARSASHLRERNAGEQRGELSKLG